MHTLNHERHRFRCTHRRWRRRRWRRRKRRKRREWVDDGVEHQPDGLSAGQTASRPQLQHPVLRLCQLLSLRCRHPGQNAWQGLFDCALCDLFLVCVCVCVCLSVCLSLICLSCLPISSVCLSACLIRLICLTCLVCLSRLSVLSAYLICRVCLPCPHVRFATSCISHNHHAAHSPATKGGYDLRACMMKLAESTPNGFVVELHTGTKLYFIASVRPSLMMGAVVDSGHFVEKVNDG